MTRKHRLDRNQQEILDVGKVKRSWLALAAVCLRVSGLIHAAESHATNGDFEQVKDGHATFWKTSGTVKPERVSGVWQRLTGTFNSGDNRERRFLFFSYQGTTGSAWIDNIAFSPAVSIRNASFEELRPDGIPSSWAIGPWNETAFCDYERASDGRRSIRITHEHEMAPGATLWQRFPVEPDTDYTYSFDVLVGDDFQGEAGAAELGVYVFISSLAETRDRCGRYALSLLPSETAPAEISQEVSVGPGMNLRAGVDINNKTFDGTARLVVEDPPSGRILAESSVTEATAGWQSLPVSFQSVSSKLRLRVKAEGKGTLRVDNAEVTPPRVTPPMQQVKWPPAAENFSLPAQMGVSVRGQAGQAVDGGLELLSKDLKKFNVALNRAEAPEAPLQVIIASTNEVEGRGPESYSLTVNRKGITIEAGAESGAFYGLMTLLQLLEERGGKPIVLACEAVDYPDMPMRGILYGDAEQAARWKMNTVMESTGYPASPEQKKAFGDSIRRCEKWSQKYIPYALAMMGGYYVQKINPNLAAGIWVRDEKVALKGTEPSPLANPHIIRTKLTDVKLKSPDGAEEYRLGVDYRVIDGDMAWNYGWKQDPIPGHTPKPFAVARLEGSSIPDGGTVLASYDWVSHHRASDNRTETHIAYVPLEPETRRLMGEFLRGLVREYAIPYTLYANCLHEFGPTEAQLATDSRVINCGKKPIQLFAEDITSLSAAVKQGNPRAKAMFWTGSMNDHYVRAAQPFISKDAHAQIWGYGANWPAAYGWEAVEYWSRLGFETSVMSWDNLRNVRGWAQVVAKARAKGYPCLGMVNACWAKRTGGFRESASVSWRVPKAGEMNHVVLPRTEPVNAREEENH